MAVKSRDGKYLRDEAVDEDRKDLAEELRNIRILLEESQEREEKAKKLAEETRKNRTRSIILLLVIVLIVSGAIFTNPNEKDFSEGITELVSVTNPQSGRDSLPMKVLLEYTVKRTNLLLFSVFSVEGRDGNATYLGIFKVVYLPLSRSAFEFLYE